MSLRQRQLPYQLAALGMSLLLGEGLLRFSLPAKAGEPVAGPKDIQVETKPAPPDVETTPPGDTSSDEPRFTCQIVDGEYTVMYHPESQPGKAYAWASPTELGSGWTEERRCNEISRRLEFYRPDGLLELRTAQENEYNIVCVTSQQDPSCRIVLTVPPGEDPQLIRDRVFENLTVADSGTQTQAVNTFVEGETGLNILGQINQELGNLLGIERNRRSPSFADGINLRPFLDPADGGTGVQLRRGLRLR